MDIVPSTSRERRLLFIETLLNETDLVSKVAPGSALSGIAGGVAKIAGKAEKDIILALSELFPDVSYGSQLDRVGANFGISGRFGALGSSTYLRLTADPGTTYVAGTHVFQSSEGPSFNLVTDVTIGAAGYEYAQVQSIDVGAKANVSPLTIAVVSPAPSGHLDVVNEFQADYGRDIETDQQYRIRIQDGGNVLAKNTLAMIEQVCIAVNTKVLKVWNYGIDNNGKRNLAVVTQNGADLTQIELDRLTNNVGPFLALSDSNWNGVAYEGILFRNVQYKYVDISFRVVLDNTANPDDVRKDIQRGISRYFDFRSFDPVKDVVQWDRLLNVVQNTKGVKYAPDQYFFPNNDVAVGAYLLPRLRGFLMLNLDGTIISNLTGTLSPVFYPNVADFSFASTILSPFL